MKKSLFILPLAALLTGCSYTPGLHLNVGNISKIPMPTYKKPRVALIPMDQAAFAHSSMLVNPGPYRVGPQDVLSITVWDHPELTIPAGQYRSAAESGNLVDSHGDIFYPFVGQLHVAGLSVEQVRVLLTKRLAKYIRNPQISVKVAAFNSQKIQVIGAVNKSATLPITNTPLSLITAINQAGGFNEQTADPRKVFVIRGPASSPKLFILNANQPSSLLLAEHFYLRNDDVVYVATSGMASWQKVLANIVPAVQSTWYADQIVK